MLLVFIFQCNASTVLKSAKGTSRSFDGGRSIERNKAFTNGLSKNRTTNKSNGLSKKWIKTDILEKLCMLEIIVCCVYDEEFYVYVHRYIEDSFYIVKECLFKYSRGYSCLLHTTGTLNKTGAHPLKTAPMICCCDFWRMRILLVECVKTEPECEWTRSSHVFS